jgi:hypothetical protein
MLDFDIKGVRYSIGMTHHGQRMDLVPDAITPFIGDYGMIQAWLALCETSHGTACRPKGTVYLPGFRVIDCETSKIIPAPYVYPRYTLSDPVSSFLESHHSVLILLILCVCLQALL